MPQVVSADGRVKLPSFGRSDAAAVHALSRLEDLESGEAVEVTATRSMAAQSGAVRVAPNPARNLRAQHPLCACC